MPQDILNIVKSEPIDLDALEQALDAASHAVRLAATRQFTPKLQKKLFDATLGRAVTLEQMIPGREPFKEVIHHGTNTLPAFREFQKRFCAPSDPAAGDVAYGYNHTPYKGLITPGYYVAYEEENSGEFWIDYTQIPPEKPEAWPEIMKNSSRLGFLVYAGMIDKMRKVSDHVTIGRAYKKNKEMSAWFVLVRED